MVRPVGRITRGTTGVNRLRRADRWICSLPAARLAGALVVDLGFGASATTTLELFSRLNEVNPTASVLGLEINPERVELARAEFLAALEADARVLGRDVGAATADGLRERVRFEVGGFELATPRKPAVVRAMNVLRQYDEGEVADVWRQLCGRLAPGGMLVEGTSNEIGRVASWITLSAAGPETFTIALKVDELGTDPMPAPSVVAERLPKALIHRNVPGERIHAALADLDAAWEASAGYASFGSAQRWAQTVAGMRSGGWPVLHWRERTRLGELTLPWSAVSPKQ